MVVTPGLIALATSLNALPTSKLLWRNSSISSFVL
jgi:hypothetical protein